MTSASVAGVCFVCVHNLEVNRGMSLCPAASISEGFYSLAPPTVFSPINSTISHVSPRRFELCPRPASLGLGPKSMESIPHSREGADMETLSLFIFV